MQTYTQNKEPEAKPLAWWQRAFQFGLPLLILGVGFVGYKKLKNSKKKPKRKPKMVMIARAEVITVNQADCCVILNAMGTVTPAETLALKARVSGEVSDINPLLEKGNLLKSGTWAVKIDQRDYKLALSKARIQKKKVEVDLMLEKGRQAVAKQEFKLFNSKDEISELDKQLTLRQPQLKLAETNLELADNDIEMRELDISRCAIGIPFNALVKTKVVTRGMQLNAQQTIAELVRSDFFYIEASVPVSNLHWLNLNDPSTNQVTVHYNTNRSKRAGRILRILSSLEEQGRMARLLIAVDNPLEIAAVEGQKLPLLLGTYVRLELKGRLMNDAFKIPRQALRDGNVVWVSEAAAPGTKEDKGNGHILHIRPITITWKNRDHIFVKDGLNSGDRVIVSDLPAAVEGMKIKISMIDNTAVADKAAPPSEVKKEGGRPTK